jgi:hypothetical protein
MEGQPEVFLFCEKQACPACLFIYLIANAKGESHGQERVI